MSVITIHPPYQLINAFSFLNVTPNYVPNAQIHLQKSAFSLTAAFVYMHLSTGVKTGVGVNGRCYQGHRV